MSTLKQFRNGLNEAWDSLLDGWQRLYRRAAGAITRYTPGKKQTGKGAGAKGRELARRNAGWGILAAEVFDDDDRVVVSVEAPGMKRGDFDIEVLGNHLVVRGEKQMRREHSEGAYRISECAYGRFERAIPLPDAVESGKASASYKKGVLRIELPKKASSRRKRIKVDMA